MKHFVGLSIIAVSIFALIGCGESNDSNGQISVFRDIDTNSYQNVGISDAKKLAKETGTDIVILDVRTPAEYAEGHIANAINIDYEAVDFSSRVARLDKVKTYLVYCRSGRRSSEASQIMTDAGFPQIINMLGGYNAWIEAGGEAVKQGI